MILCVLTLLLFFFFFQAEDGIRDVAVTGVQTCALPIYDLGLAPQGMHRAAKTHPVEEFLLPGVLDFRSREFPPARQLARGELVEARPVARIVGIEVMVLWRQERVRPARRRDERNPPRAVGEDLRDRAADIK